MSTRQADISSPPRPKVGTRAERQTSGTALWTLASVLVALAVPIALVGANLNLMLYDPGYYAQGQARFAVGRTTEYPLDALLPIDRAIAAFFASPGLSLPTALVDAGASPDVFNAREVGHMEDVRSLVRMVSRLANVAVAVIVAVGALRFATDRVDPVRWIGGRILAGAGITIALLLALGAMTLIDFQSLFLTFHLVSFDNDLWQLDPRRDNLIRFFPFEFWLDASVTLAVRTVLSALAVGIAAFAVVRWRAVTSA